jgi:PRC-barrel domain
MTEPPVTPPPSLPEARNWIGHRVDEIGGARVGRVRGLFVDAESGEPSWLIAKLGGLRGRLVAVPMRDCAAAGGSAWVAHESRAIRSAPVVDPTRPLLREHELTISAHYGIGEGLGRAAEVAARKEGSVTSQPAP